MTIADSLLPHVVAGELAGLAYIVARGGDIESGALGTETTDSIFRIASLTKAVAAAAALALVDDGVVALDDPVTGFLPELGDLRVLRDPTGPIDDTVPAIRPLTPRHLLTSLMGSGWNVGSAGPDPVMAEVAAAGLGSGPPQPLDVVATDEWMRRLAAIPLSYQPGERWLYDLSYDVLGVLVARVSGRRFGEFLRSRLFEPLGMTDTGFSVGGDQLQRLGACSTTDPTTGDRTVFDPSDGHWSAEPAFESGRGGLVSTVADYHRFAAMLLDGGRGVLSPAAVAAMTTDQLSAAQRGASSPDGAGDLGWGYGVAVQRHAAPGAPKGTYGWDGGLGSTWRNDPSRRIVAVLLTNEVWNSPVLPPVCDSFYGAVFAG